MRIIYSLDEMTETARGWLAAGSVGFVPTMGYLHEGHLTLVQAAKKECEISIISIFVNPLQFASQQELTRYPHDLARDLQALSKAQVDVVFIPRAEQMYPSTFSTYITPVGPLAEQFEAAINPNYARGIATSITKLFQIVRPDIAYFGQKDAQRVAIVQQLVRDLNIDVSLCVLPTMRERDRVALSSRNAALSSVERQAAGVIYQSLLMGKAVIDEGERRSSLIEQAMRDHIATNPLVHLDYAAICDARTFVPLPEAAPGAILLAAARIGTTRLVDNIVWMQDGQWQL